MLNAFYGNEPESFKDLCESLNNLTGNTNASELAIDWFKNNQSEDLITVDEHLEVIACLEGDLEDANESAVSWENQYHALSADVISILKDTITQIKDL